MYNEWSLDIYYKGIDDPELEHDMKKLEEIVEQYKSEADRLDETAPLETLKKMIGIREEMIVLSHRLGGYFFLRRATDSTDSASAKYSTRIQALLADTTKASVAFEKYVGTLENLETLLSSDPVLNEYQYYFTRIQKAVSHKMSDEAESVFAQMDLSGGKSWGELFDYLTATLEVDYNGEISSLSEIRGLSDNADGDVRKAAYEAEIASYRKIKDSIAFALNSIKAQVNLEAKLRGYKNPLEMTLEQSWIQKETLDAMFLAMRESLPHFHRYLKHKAKLLGYEGGLPWFELAAPMGNTENLRFTVEESHQYLIEHFKTFAPDMAEMIDRAYKENWIDFYPRSGKVGGAFCSHVPFANQSRILTNYSGNFSAIMTLAHELGHAYHDQQISDHRPLNMEYTMPVAETASTLNELVIVNDAINHAIGSEKLALIEAQLQDCTQTIADIYSRFLFEDEVFRRRSDTFLFADVLEKIMLNAQKEAFGDGLDPNYMHPYMWCCKSHYYSSDLSYYNFPYAFGGLFSRGLYAQYLEEGEAFIPKYRALLKATSIDTVENVAKRAGIDLTKPDFWRKSLATIIEQIDLFIEETSK